jgi:hypothetical protein
MFVREIIPRRCTRKSILHGVIDYAIFVPEDIRFVREEDLAFPESDRGQPEKHSPHRAHQNGHHGVRNKETWNLKRVAKNAESRNPADIRERQSPAFITTNPKKNPQKLKKKKKQKKKKKSVHRPRER